MSALRLVLGFAVGLAVATALGLQGTIRGVVILESAMPSPSVNCATASTAKKTTASPAPPRRRRTGRAACPYCRYWGRQGGR